jgi:hypothetical protein
MAATWRQFKCQWRLFLIHSPWNVNLGISWTNLMMLAIWYQSLWRWTTVDIHFKTSVLQWKDKNSCSTPSGNIWPARSRLIPFCKIRYYVGKEIAVVNDVKTSYISGRNSANSLRSRINHTHTYNFLHSWYSRQTYRQIYTQSAVGQVCLVSHRFLSPLAFTMNPLNAAFTILG